MDDIPSYLSLLILETEGVGSAGWMMTALKILVVIVLVAINGFFVAAEFAFVGVRRSRIETLAASGDRAARRLITLLNNLNAYLSASQLGITLASLALGWVGEPT
jgi:CBS domain containing-hemolysin-like protein